MNNLGIIAEYNPFHNGHLYHMKESKRIAKADAVVAVISGNFTQRGEPALYDKWLRAEMAVRNGVDLVVELPFIFACNNAEYFAYGAIRILEKLGCISCFSFGSESGEIAELTKAAKSLAWESDNFKVAIKEYLNKGLSYPKARYEALREIEGDETAASICHANNILGVEYLKQWMRLDSSMKPLTIKRRGKAYLDGDFSHPMASATAIRKGILEDPKMAGIIQSLPGVSLQVMKNVVQAPAADSEKLFKLLAYEILTSSKEQLSNIFSVGEGLENSLKKAVIKSRTMDEIVALIISKRYTETRIRRLLIHTIMSLTKSDFFNIATDPNLYARILGISHTGRKLLRYINSKRCSSIPIISNMNKDLAKDDPAWKILSYDILSSSIYNLAYAGDMYERSDYVCKPYVEQ